VKKDNGLVPREQILPGTKGGICATTWLQIILLVGDVCNAYRILPHRGFVSRNVHISSS